MSAKENDKGGNLDLPETLWKSFWQVLTLPFRLIRFVYRRLAQIPLKNLLLMSFFFVALIVITLIIIVKVTSQPSFCVTCHYMKPYFASWEESSHHEVHCTECHFPPGVTSAVRGKFTAISMLVNYATGVYRKSKPWAEISDQSCLREGCHKTRLLQGRVPFKEGIIFDHTHHLTHDRRGKTLRCTSCHSQIVQGTHMTVTEETCFLCHFKDQPESSQMTSCTWCHEAPVATDSSSVLFDHTDMVHAGVDCRLCHGDMVRGDGNVPRERCSYCHAEVGKLEQYSRTVKIHQIHIAEHKVECNHCHNTVLHRSIARSGEIKPDCQACHVDRHLAQYQLFSGQGAIGVDPMPSTMFHAGLGCKACHVLLPDGWREHPDLATAKAGPASCEPCHEKGYFKLYEQAKPVLNRRISEAKKRVESLKRKPMGDKSSSILQRDSDNIEFLKRAHPIHNLSYTDRILAEIDRSLSELEGKKSPPRTFPDTTIERCVRCHYGQDEVIVAYGDRFFSHRNHVHGEEVGCTTCHIEEQPHHGELRKGSYCMDCHHQSAAVSCDPCHSSQRELIEAQGVFAAFEADPMFEAGLTCRDCHEVAGLRVKRPTAETCETCHEPGYLELLRETSTKIINQLDAAERALRKLPPSATRDWGFKLIGSLRADGTGGAHNTIAAEAALDSIQAIIGLKKVDTSSESKE